MKFGIEQYAILAMKSGKRQITDRVKLPNQVIIRMLEEKESYKNLGIFEVIFPFFFFFWLPKK